MTNTKCIIIHGCPSNKEKNMDAETRTYDKHWIPWTKQQLTDKGIKTETPLMPNPWEPVYEDFKAEFEKLEVDENTILVGHSCGSAFLVRWLTDTKRQIFKLVLVAPWKIPQPKREGADVDFYTYDIDKNIGENVKEIYMFTAPDEDEDGKTSLKIFHDAIGGEIINLEKHGHYTMGDMGTEEFPELIQVITK